MNRNERLLVALGHVNEKYIKEAESNMRSSPLAIAIAACLIVALSLFLFIPYAPVTSDLSAYESSSYFPLIEGIEDYRLSFMQPKFKNNFEAIGSVIKELMAPKYDYGADMAPGDAMAPELNGSYVESTDNQVNGVIESDIFKMSDKYIFRIGYNQRPVLYVYSIDKEDSELVGIFNIPLLEGSYQFNDEEMYISEDCNTVTLIKPFSNGNRKAQTAIFSIDVSDIKNITLKGTAIIDGSLNTSRMANGKLLLVTEYVFNRNGVEYNDPSTFVPTIDTGDGPRCIEFEDIIYPNEIGSTRYSVVSLFNSETFEIIGANALLNFTSTVYVSRNNIYITRVYTTKTQSENNKEIISDMTDIAVLDYSGDSLTKKGIITVRGHAKDQYNFDENDGFLRVVTSTSDGTQSTLGNSVSFRPKQNVSLYIFDLSDNSLAYKVEDFAIEGEEATAVRFDGDKLYVCTAVVVSFTDPVYFFDLSDYENIFFSDTGVIEGYSTSLINFGNGFSLGIGVLSWRENKVSVYEQQGDSVVAVDEFFFNGLYSEIYKSYLVNRDEGLFGFAVNNYYDEQTGRYLEAYVLLHFDGYKLNAHTFEIDDCGADYVRAAYIDGYLYITTTDSLFVEKVN